MATSKGAQMHVGMTPILQNLIEMKKHQNQNQKLFGGSPSRLNTDPGTDNTVHIDKLVSTGLLGIKLLPATAEKRIQNYVQIYQNDAECSQLKLNPAEELKEGQSLVARYFSNNRFIVFRGKVLGADEDPSMVKLLLVDELQVRSISREALYHITPEFQAKPFLAAVVELAGVPKLLTAFPSIYDKLLKDFIEENRSQELLLRYVEDGEHFQKVRVPLPGNGGDLGEILQRKIVSQMLEKPLTRSESAIGVICHAKSNGDVYMHLNSKINVVEDLTDFLTDQCEGRVGSRFEVLDKGAMYLAPYDGSWFRARIEKIDGERGVIRVHYIDYGNNDRVERDQLILAADIDPILEQIPPLCFRVHIKGVGKIIDINRFQEHFDQQEYEIVVKEEGDPPTVLLIDTSKDELEDEYYLNKYIIREEMATRQ